MGIHRFQRSRRGRTSTAGIENRVVAMVSVQTLNETGACLRVKTFTHPLAATSGLEHT